MPYHKTATANFRKTLAVTAVYSLYNVNGPLSLQWVTVSTRHPRTGWLASHRTMGHYKKRPQAAATATEAIYIPLPTAEARTALSRRASLQVSIVIPLTSRREAVFS